MEEDSPEQSTHPDNVQGAAPEQFLRPDPVMTITGLPDSSLVTAIPTHDRDASTGLSRRESFLHPRETPMVSETIVTETWRPRDSGRETLPRNSSSSPTRKPSPVYQARRRFRQDRP